MTYYQKRNDLQGNNMPVSEFTRNQIINILMNKFYTHKSFDLQSDMEFLPHIPAGINENKFSNIKAPVHPTYRDSDW